MPQGTTYKNINNTEILYRNRSNPFHSCSVVFKSVFGPCFIYIFSH